jgi:hypothetical protein
MSAGELRLELDELRRLESLAKHPRVQILLANEIRNVEAKVAPLLLFYLLPLRRLGGFRSVSADCLFVLTDSDCDGSWRRQPNHRLSHWRRLLRQRPRPLRVLF